MNIFLSMRASVLRVRLASPPAVEPGWLNTVRMALPCRSAGAYTRSLLSSTQAV